ncbi:MAG TPA: hypothetical protein VKZ60_17845 [Chloroflexota bacterium]|jgi:hypothetical protein|nr:hypothetical protein [Chloroflexota bacterium]
MAQEPPAEPPAGRDNVAPSCGDPSAPEETIEIISHVFQEWKRTHPEGTWRAFWAAVAAGEVQIPTA